MAKKTAAERRAIWDAVVNDPNAYRILTASELLEHEYQLTKIWEATGRQKSLYHHLRYYDWKSQKQGPEEAS